MQNLCVWDNRLTSSPGVRPPYKELIEVGEKSPLADVIDWVVFKSWQYSGDVRVIIMAHGIESATVRGVYTQAQGGFGVSLCKETLTLDTVERFAPWKKIARPPATTGVKQIDIRGCGAAYIVPGRDGQIGDGNYLCYKLAQITGSYVRASTAPQPYDFTRMVFLPWVGLVQTYGPTGGPGVAPIRD